DPHDEARQNLLAGFVAFRLHGFRRRRFMASLAGKTFQMVALVSGSIPPVTRAADTAPASLGRPAVERRRAASRPEAPILE
ncbi:hypothetical protein, partial [Methylobacterium tarhaniae]|uniref:hypothetical protein n=1 Tax=Methylobacterium tarhaniae TaxID=1187852 RepID=UPI003CFF5953